MADSDGRHGRQVGILEENRTFISSRPGCILCRLDEMESWAYLDDLLP